MVFRVAHRSETAAGGVVFRRMGNRIEVALGEQRDRLTGAPTGTQQSNYTIAAADLEAEVGRLRTLETELKAFEQQLEKAGVPYTPGRWP